VKARLTMPVGGVRRRTGFQQSSHDVAAFSDNGKMERSLHEQNDNN